MPRFNPAANLDSFEPAPLSPESVALAQAALAALKELGSEELSKRPSLLEASPDQPPPAADKPKRAPRVRRVRRADLRLWDAVFELDEPAAREAFDDGAPASVERSGKNLFDRFLDGVQRDASRPDSESADPATAQPIAADLPAKALAIATLLDERGSRLTGIEWPHRQMDDHELGIDPASRLGREQALKRWRIVWRAYPAALQKALARVAVGWDAQTGPGRLSIERALDCAVEFNPGSAWGAPLHLAGDLVEASGFSLTPTQWSSALRTVDLRGDPAPAFVIAQFLTPRKEPLTPELGRACAQAAMGSDDAQLLAKVASLGGLSSIALYGGAEQRQAFPTLLWALQSHPKKKTSDGKTLGRDCFELLAKIPEMTQSAQTHFKASALAQCDGEEALSLFARFPFMASVDAEGQNIAHAWSQGRYLSIQSLHKLKKLLNGGFSALLSQPDAAGKTPIDWIKSAHGTLALKAAINDWSETYAKWEKKEMSSGVPAQRSAPKAKNTVRKRL